MPTTETSPFDKGDEFDFADLAPQTRLVRNLPGHPGKEFQLREASEGAHIAYKNSQARSARVDDGKFAGVGDIHDADAVLLGACLFAVSRNGESVTYTAVGPSFAKTIPHRAADPLTEWVKRASGLTRDDAPEGDPPGKSVPPGTTDSSGTAAS